MTATQTLTLALDRMLTFYIQVQTLSERVLSSRTLLVRVPAGNWMNAHQFDDERLASQLEAARDELCVSSFLIATDALRCRWSCVLTRVDVR